MFSEFEQYWLYNKWLCWGVGPILAANVGFFVSAFILELALRSNYFDDSLINYGKNGDRKTRISQFAEKISFREQMKASLWTMLGPAVLKNGFLGVMVMNFFYPITPETFETKLSTIIMQTVLCIIIGDFFLYWGHRVQHMNEYLWNNFHKYHHSIGTPTPINTVYIDSIDTTLQVGLPIIISFIMVKPHPYALYAYVCARVADNTVNHCGLNSPFINALFLKYLPFRGTVGHHDAHHRFSNYSKNAKNYGEFFWLWDWIFGTFTDVATLTQSKN